MPKVLFSGPHLQATYNGDSRDTLVITFDHWRKSRDGWGAHGHGTRFVDRGATSLHINTRENDWFLNGDLPALLSSVAEFAQGYARVLGLSFSMGGYGLVLVSRVVEFSGLMFISPHTTFAPELPARAPIGDPRFAPGRMDMRLARMTHGLIYDSDKAPGDCIVIFDPDSGEDARHGAEVARLFEAPRMVELPGLGHPISSGLTDHQGFKLIMDTLFSEPMVLRPLLRTYRRMRREAARANQVA